MLVVLELDCRRMVENWNMMPGALHPGACQALPRARSLKYIYILSNIPDDADKMIPGVLQSVLEGGTQCEDRAEMGILRGAKKAPCQVASEGSGNGQPLFLANGDSSCDAACSSDSAKPSADICTAALKRVREAL